MRYVTTTPGYINHRFTGELIDTAANYVGAMADRPDTWSGADPEVLSKYNIPGRCCSIADAGR